MKEKLVGVNAQIDKTEEKMCEPEAQAQELFKMKNIWGKKKRQQPQGAMEKLQVAAITCKYIHFIVPKEMQNNRKIFEEIMATVFFFP